MKKSKKTPKNLIGPAIRKLRMSQREKVTQQDLVGRLAARGILIDRTAILRIETGERRVFDYEAAAIADAFHVPIETLFMKTE